MRRALTVFVVVGAVVLAGCSPPPPALPTSVLDSGVEGLSKDHPPLTQAQREQCRLCHRASDAP